MLWGHSGDFVGVASVGVIYGGGDKRIRVQVFTYAPYYYRWIEHVTGLEVPKCSGPQANTFSKIQLDEYQQLPCY